MAKKLHKVGIGRFLVGLLLILLVVGAFGFLAILTNGFTSDFSDFYIKVGNEKITDNKTMTFAGSESVQFDCRYIFGDKSSIKKYTVKIVPNPAYDFDFIVNGHIYPFSDEGDLSRFFSVVQTDDHFKITCDKNVADILKDIYAPLEVDVPVTAENQFTLIVNTYNDKKQIYVNFNYVFAVTEVTIDRDRVEVWI